MATTTAQQSAKAISTELDRLVNETRLFISYFKDSNPKELARQFPKIPLIIVKIEHVLNNASNNNNSSSSSSSNNNEDGKSFQPKTLRRQSLLSNVAVSPQGSKRPNPTRYLLQELTGEVETIGKLANTNMPADRPLLAQYPRLPQLTLGLLAEVKLVIWDFVERLLNAEEAVAVSGVTGAETDSTAGKPFSFGKETLKHSMQPVVEGMIILRATIYI